MHIVTSLMWILGALLVLLIGLIGVLNDLVERTPYEPPLLDNPHVWPPRYRGVAASDTCRTGSSNFRDAGRSIG